jgi:hypothetical protein
MISRSARLQQELGRTEMEVQSHVDTIAMNTTIHHKFTARLLGLSPQTLAKGLQAGVIPEITAANLSALTDIPVLTRVRTDDGFDVPILRAGVQAPSPWDAYTPARPYTGYSTSMTDHEVLSATDRWWPYSGSNSVLAAGGTITALGGWTVVLLAVDGIAMERPGGGNCLHYDARLVARCDSVIDQQIRVIDPTHPFAARAHELLGKRVLGGGGGTITRLATSDTA